MTCQHYTQSYLDYKLKPKLSSIVNSALKGFKRGDKTFIRLSHNGAAYWGKKTKGGLGFSKTSFKTAVNHLIENFYFNVGNVAMKQAIGIPMGFDPEPFWANLFLCSYEQEYMSSLISSDKIKARHFYSAKLFIDDLCAINDCGEFGRTICEIYPKELEFKVKHQADHATFLNEDITIKEGVFICKLFQKRDSFPFLIVRMPHKESNIPQNIF